MKMPISIEAEAAVICNTIDYFHASDLQYAAMKN